MFVAIVGCFLACPCFRPPGHSRRCRLCPQMSLPQAAPASPE
jgi:hypothetical protein